MTSNNNPWGMPSDDGSNPFEEFFKKLSENGFPGAQGNPAEWPLDPEQMKNMGIPIDPAQIAAVFSGLTSMSAGASADEPVNWELAKSHAHQAVSQGEDPKLTTAQESAVADAIQLAQLWVDPATAFSPTGYPTESWSKADYVNNTFDIFQEIAGPIATSLSEAMNQSMSEQLPEEIKHLLGGQTNILSGVGGMMFGIQAGQAIGRLAQEVVSSTDVGLPMAEGRSALLPSAIKDFGDGLEIPPQEVMIYLAVREVALTRLYKAAKWLREDIVALIKRYARGIHVDIERMQQEAEQIDIMDQEALQIAFSSNIFTPQNTEDQKLALERLEMLLALVEGWVTVVAEDATKNLPMSSQLAEVMNRRHAVGGPTEHIFAALLGLELHPRKNREAAQFWRHYTQEYGLEARDQLWEAPEMLPTLEELDNPEAYASRTALVTASEDEFDAALEKLLSGGYDQPEDTSEDDDKPQN
ncbi:zinc-dependent metalloprotease [Rothia sp. P7181]|uniref:zinc-dependent metalloprotease n=1 Tax=Rothia sp. P7181 TaxID=3402663 RepID=UPI003AE515A8